MQSALVCQLPTVKCQVQNSAPQHKNGRHDSPGHCSLNPSRYLDVVRLHRQSCNDENTTRNSSLKAPLWRNGIFAENIQTSQILKNNSILLAVVFGIQSITFKPGIQQNISEIQFPKFKFIKCISGVSLSLIIAGIKYPKLNFRTFSVENLI